MIATKSWVIDLLKKFNKKKDVYSTDEVQIGTWIDGKPIYRKVINANIPKNTQVYNINISNTDFEDVVRLDGILNNATPLMYQNNSGGIYKLSISTANKEISYQATVTFTDVRPLMIIFEYTKTTD